MNLETNRRWINHVRTTMGFEKISNDLRMKETIEVVNDHIKDVDVRQNHRFKISLIQKSKISIQESIHNSNRLVMTLKK